MNTTGDRIRYLRKVKRLTQKELGSIIGVGKTTISNWETNYSKPDNDSLVSLSNTLDCTTDYLLCNTDDTNTTLIKDEKLPKELQGLFDAIEIAKDAGLTDEDIQELLILHAKHVKNNKQS